MQLTVPLNIYSKPWLMEPAAAMQLLDCWEQIRAGNAEWEPEAQSARLKFFAMDGVSYAPTSTREMNDFAGFSGSTVAVIPVAGPLMKQDYCGSLGTASIISLIKMADNTPSVQRIVFEFDTPGGTVDGTQAFADAIKGATKPTTGIVSGMCCSAGYWAASACDELFASSDTDIIGSIGTMYSIRDNSAAMEKNGVVERTYYADGSKNKNRIFTDAKNGDGKALVEQHLNPMNDIFLGSVRSNRAKKVNEEALTGSTYIGAQAVAMGLVDGIRSMDNVLKPKQLVTANSNFNYNSKTIKMDLNQFRAEHPEVYAQAIAAERDRTGAWLTFVDVDPKAVAEGINSGLSMTQKQMVELTRKSFSKEMVSGVKADSEATPATSAAAPLDNVVPAPEASPEAVAHAKQQEEWAAKLDKALGGK